MPLSFQEIDRRAILLICARCSAIRPSPTNARRSASILLPPPSNEPHDIPSIPCGRVSCQTFVWSGYALTAAANGHRSAPVAIASQWCGGRMLQPHRPLSSSRPGEKIGMYPSIAHRMSSLFATEPGLLVSSVAGGFVVMLHPQTCRVLSSNAFSCCSTCNAFRCILSI